MASFHVFVWNCPWLWKLFAAYEWGLAKRFAGCVFVQNLITNFFVAILFCRRMNGFRKIYEKPPLGVVFRKKGMLHFCRRWEFIGSLFLILLGIRILKVILYKYHNSSKKANSRGLLCRYYIKIHSVKDLTTIKHNLFRQNKLKWFNKLF